MQGIGILFLFNFSANADYVIRIRLVNRNWKFHTGFYTSQGLIMLRVPSFSHLMIEEGLRYSVSSWRWFTT